MNHHRTTAFAVCFIAISLAVGCESNEKPKEPPAAVAAPAPEKPLTVEESFDVTLTATVAAIDHASRVITLRDAAGHQTTFTVGNVVQRLNEVNVGDNVRTRYRAKLLAELRAPTAAEAAEPIAAVDISGRAPQSAAPAGGVAQAVRVVTTVEAVDLPNMRVTLRGPMGDLAVVRGRKPENMQKLRVGDTIVITYTESLVISLDKVAAR